MNICTSEISQTENLVGLHGFLIFLVFVGIISVIIPRHHILFSILLTNILAPNNRRDKSLAFMKKKTLSKALTYKHVS